MIYGGKSAEHEVSLKSAASVVGAIPRDKYEVILVGINKEGRWLLGDGARRMLESGVNEPQTDKLVLLPDASVGLMELDLADNRRFTQQIDVVFPVLHGTYGEDGTIQGLFELADVPYVGAGVVGSAVGMDKGMMKAVFREAGLPVVDRLVLRRSEWRKDESAVLRRIEERLSYPVFVKPANLGSSVGVSKARDGAELAQAISLAARYDRRILVEAAVPNPREIECSVLGNDEPIASVPGEIIPSREFYDYEAKYIDDRSRLIIPAELDASATERVRDLAVRAFQAVDCSGMGRVDFLVSRDDGSIWVNEINTIPGFTSISMYPKLWEASGLSYPDLLDRLIQLALERYREKHESSTSYY